MPQAYAAPAAQGGDFFLSLLPLVVVMAIVYLFMFRPQQKRAAAHRKALSEMKRGDRVVTNSGVVGTIAKVKDTEFVLEVADDVQILVVKDAIAALYTPGVRTSSTEAVDKESGEGKPKKTKASSTKTKK